MSKLTYPRGTRATWTHVYKVNGTPATTGQTLLFTVKPKQYDTDVTDNTAIVKKTVAMSGSTNLITILENDVADTVGPGDYYYDIKVVDSSMGVVPAASGVFTITATPTNRTA